MMATVYIICLIVGGGLLLLSSIFSSHGDTGDVTLDHGGGFDHGVDSALGHHPSAFSLATWFSLQFLIYFVAVLGLVGTTLHYGSSMSAGAVLLTSFVAALGVGQIVHQALRYLKRTGRGSEISVEDFVNKPARVTVTIAPPRHGEVAVPLHSGERFVSAVAKRAHDSFRAGDSVVVVGFSNGVAEVVSRKEFEFVSGKDA
jgi:hypothetical protein